MTVVHNSCRKKRKLDSDGSTSHDTKLAKISDTFDDDAERKLGVEDHNDRSEKHSKEIHGQDHDEEGTHRNDDPNRKDSDKTNESDSDEWDTDVTRRLQEPKVLEKIARLEELCFALMTADADTEDASPFEQDRNDSIEILQDVSDDGQTDDRNDHPIEIADDDSDDYVRNRDFDAGPIEIVKVDMERLRDNYTKKCSDSIEILEPEFSNENDYGSIEILQLDSQELRRDSEQIDTEDVSTDYQVLPELYRPSDDDEMSDLLEEFDGYDSDVVSTSWQQQQLDECLAVAYPHYRNLGALEKEQRSKSPQPDSNVAKVVDQQSKGSHTLLQSVRMNYLA